MRGWERNPKNRFSFSTSADSLSNLATLVSKIANSVGGSHSSSKTDCVSIAVVVDSSDSAILTAASFRCLIAVCDSESCARCCLYNSPGTVRVQVNKEQNSNGI